MITGCGSGLGSSLVKKSINYPAKIFAHYRSGNIPNALIGDITQNEFLNCLPKYLEDNNIDVFINNAAIYTNGTIIDTTDEQITQLIYTNLTSQILILKRVFEFFNKKKSGLIVNINSLAGLYPSPKESVYCASKFGLYGFSKSLQLEAIGGKIEIVDVFPGAMKTKMTYSRSNYEFLMDTCEIAETIYDIVFNDKKHFITEVVIRRKKDLSMD